MENLVLKSLIEKRDKLLQQLDVIESMIAEEERNTSIQSNKIDFDKYRSEPMPAFRRTNINKFKLGKTDNEKFLGILKKEQRFMKVREIAKEVSEIEGGTIDEWVLKLSRKTKKLRELDKIVKIQVGSLKTNTFWGSPNWIDDNGNIIEGYEFNPDAVEKKGANSIKNYEL